MDAALGETHPAAVTMQNICSTDWPNLEHRLQGMPDDVRPYLPSMLLWFHKRFGPFSGGLLSGRPLPVPRLELFTELIEFRSFHNLPPMLGRYIQAPPDTTLIMLTPLGTRHLRPVPPVIRDLDGTPISGRQIQTRWPCSPMPTPLPAEARPPLLWTMPPAPLWNSA